MHRHTKRVKQRPKLISAMIWHKSPFTKHSGLGTSHPFTFTQLMRTFSCLVNSYAPLNQGHYAFLYLAYWDWTSSIKSTYIFFFRKVYWKALQRVSLPIFLSAYKHLFHCHITHVSDMVGTRNGRRPAASWRYIIYLPVYTKVKAFKFRLLLDLPLPYLNQLIVLKYYFWISLTQSFAEKHVLGQTSVKA